MVRALIHVPSTAKSGEVIEIKTLISHVMETGYRIGVTGAPIPRDIIDQFVCTYNGEEIFRAQLSPPSPPIVSSRFSPSPQLADVDLLMTDQHGATQVQTAEIKVE